jgi:hypothetical protein
MKKVLLILGGLALAALLFGGGLLLMGRMAAMTARKQEAADLVTRPAYQHGFTLGEKTGGEYFKTGGLFPKENERLRLGEVIAQEQQVPLPNQPDFAKGFSAGFQAGWK